MGRRSRDSGLRAPQLCTWRLIPVLVARCNLPPGLAAWSTHSLRLAAYRQGFIFVRKSISLAVQVLRKHNRNIQQFPDGNPLQSEWRGMCGKQPSSVSSNKTRLCERSGLYIVKRFSLNPVTIVELSAWIKRIDVASVYCVMMEGDFYLAPLQI